MGIAGPARSVKAGHGLGVPPCLHIRTLNAGEKASKEPQQQPAAKRATAVRAGREQRESCYRQSPNRAPALAANRRRHEQGLGCKPAALTKLMRAAACSHAAQKSRRTDRERIRLGWEVSIAVFLSFSPRLNADHEQQRSVPGSRVWLCQCRHGMTGPNDKSQRQNGGKRWS